METRRLSDKELKVVTKKMLTELERSLDQYSENQSELKTTIMKVKTTVGGINSRSNNAGEWISDLEVRVVKIIRPEQQKEKRNEDGLRD